MEDTTDTAGTLITGSESRPPNLPDVELPYQFSKERSRDTDAGKQIDVVNRPENPDYHRQITSLSENQRNTDAANDQRNQFPEENLAKDHANSHSQSQLKGSISPQANVKTCGTFTGQRKSGDGREKSTNEEAIRSYVKENFKTRECRPSAFNPMNEVVAGISGNRCQCGRDQDWQNESGIKVNSAMDIWTSSYGTISFKGFKPGTFENEPYYIRVDSRPRDQDHLEKCWTLLNKHWEMPPPKLIISVTGGAKYFSMTSQLKGQFKRGLMKAATTTEAWILTGGTATGVMKFVGEAVRDHNLTTSGSGQKIVALGIVPWGCVDEKEKLVAGDGNGSHSTNGLFPAVYGDMMAHDTRGVAPLDSNHTHFLLVDDGTEGKFGKEIPFRTAFEEYISKELKVTDNVAESQKKHVPAVILVLEGGENTILTALEGLKKGTPVVVVEGSGRAADIIAEGYKRTLSKEDAGNGADVTLFWDNFDEHFLKAAKSLFSSENEEKVEKKTEKCLQHLKDLLEYRHLVTVFTLDDFDATLEIDQAILDAILKAKKTDSESRLNLALAWDRCEVARQEILKIENKAHWKDNEGRDLIFNALVQDKADQVHLLMEHGVDLKKFLTVRRLQDLYAHVLDDRSYGNSAGLLRTGLQIVQERPRGHGEELELRHVNEVLNHWLWYLHQNLYYDKKYEINGKKDDNVKQQKQSQDIADQNHQVDFPHPEKHLLIWATLLNRKSLADLFWKMNENPIGSALMASALLKSLSKQADQEKQTDLSLELNKHSMEFEGMAIGVLNECYQLDETMAHKLLIRVLGNWDDTTLLTMANLAKQVDFMGHAACQTKLTEIWRGEIALHTPIWKIGFALVNPFVLSRVKFAKEPGRQKGNEPVNQTDSCHSNTWHKLYEYYTAPMVKFGYHTMQQAFFLFLFSIFVLTNLRPAAEPNSPGAAEITVWFWVATIIIEDLRQLISKSYAPRQSFRSWIGPRLLIHCTFFVSIILRYTLEGSKFTVARGSYCLTLCMYYMSLLPVSSVAKNTGKKYMMILPMLKDLMFFLFIFIIFTLAYGVASQALRFPNSDVDLTLPKNVVYWPYWHWFGELSLDQLEGDDCSRNKTELELDPRLMRCPEESQLTIVLFAIYMVLTNIVLTNLLIAVFSYTFGKKQEKSLKLWRYHRYKLIHEYCERPVLSPPFIIFNHIWMICKYGFSKKNERQNTPFRQLFEEKDNIQMTVFERQAMENHIFHLHVSSRQTVDIKVTGAGERIKKVVDDLELIKEHLNIGSRAGKTPSNSKAQGDSGLLQKLVNLQQQLQVQQQQLIGQQQQLQEAIDLLRDKGKHDGHSEQLLNNNGKDGGQNVDPIPLTIAGRVSVAGQSELEAETSTA